MTGQLNHGDAKALAAIGSWAHGDALERPHRLAIAIHVVSVGWFALLWLPSLLGTAGPPPMPVETYLQTVILCQIPATLVVGLLYSRHVGRQRFAAC